MQYYGNYIQIMKSSFITLVLLLVALPFEAFQKFLITAPPALIKSVSQRYPEGIPFSVANYGDVPFGTTLSGTVYLPIVLQNCKEQELSDPEAKGNINKIVLSMRGDCTFTTKSLASQNQGAKLAIIADNITTQDPSRIILVDDGRGPQVKIPTIFISEQLGQMIQNTTLSGQKVNIAFRFDLNKKQKADVSLWINSNDRKSYIFIRQLQPFFERISQYSNQNVNIVDLKVLHPTISCRTCFETDCYSQNKYCINTGYMGYFIPNLGQNIIQQQLREEFIYETQPDLWWNYMGMYDDECDQIQSMTECSIDVMKSVGIDSGKIESMVNQSFQEVEVIDPETNETNKVVENKRLQKNSQLNKKSGLITYPSIVVNNITYHGNLQGLDVFEMICNSLLEQPEECSFEIQQPQTPWKIIIPIIIIFLLFMIFLIACYRRKVRRALSSDINKEVNSLVNQYITMYEAQKFENSEQPPK